MSTPYTIRLDNPKDTPQELADKLNQLHGAIDHSVIKGSVDRKEYDDFSGKVKKYMDTKRDRIDTNDLRWHGGGIGKINSGMIFNLPFGINLTGVRYVNVVASNLSTGNNDLYTCPVGKRAMVATFNPSFYQNSGGNILVYPQVKIGGTYYPIGSTLTVATNTASNLNFASSPFVLEPTEIFSLNTATNNGLNGRMVVIEFDSSNSFYSSRSLVPASGNNTVYTVPINKTAIVCGNVTSAFISNPMTFVNYSGGSLNKVWYVVPSGGSPDSTNILIPSSAIGNVTSVSSGSGFSIGSGDYIVLNLSGTGTGSIAWITVMEM